MHYIKEHPVYYRWTPLFTVLLGTGCRIGEAVGLRWDDLDYDKRLISINHSVVYYPLRDSVKARSVRMVSMPKTEAGIRIIPMMEVVYQAFKEEYEYQKETGFNTSVIDGMSGFIFTNRNGRFTIRRQLTG